MSTIAATVRLSALFAGLAFSVTELAAQRPRPEVPYVPTPHEVVTAMLEVAQVDSTDVVYDLGSGDGRIVIAAACNYGARGIGVDIDPDRVADGVRNARRAGVDHIVEFREGDLFEMDLSGATVVTLYLLSEVNYRLRPLLFEQLRPGTRVVSHAFDMRDWQPDSLLLVTHPGGQARVYYWVIPARAEGDWVLSIGGQEAGTIRLSQRFQMIEGSLSADARSTDLEAPVLTADRVSFTIVTGEPGREVRLRLTGRVNGGEMRGTVHGTGEEWRAVRAGG